MVKAKALLLLFLALAAVSSQNLNDENDATIYDAFEGGLHPHIYSTIIWPYNNATADPA